MGAAMIAYVGKIVVAVVGSQSLWDREVVCLASRRRETCMVGLFGYPQRDSFVASI